MSIDVKKIVIAVLSAIVAILGGNAYQTSSSLNDVQKNVTQLSKSLEDLKINDSTKIDTAESE